MVMAMKLEETEILLVRSRFHGELWFVNVTKTLTLLAATLAVAPINSQAQLTDTRPAYFQANSVANYRQLSTGVVFDGGTFSFELRDGLSIFEAGCIGPAYFPPSPRCPIGATGYITRGDVNGDGVEDAGRYQSVLSIARASAIRPFEPEKIALVSAPASRLPRPLRGFVDNSRSMFFNLMAPPYRQYVFTNYTFDRTYTPANRTSFDEEIVPGSYVFNCPSIASTIYPVVITVNMFKQLDGFRKINNQRQGFQFTNVRRDLRYDSNFAVLNPNVINTITWEGNTLDLIAPAADRAYFSIKALEDDEDPLSDPSPGTPIFPNFTGPPGSVTRVLLDSPLEQSYTLAPNFLIPGQTGIVDLEFEIYRPTTSAVEELTTRRFRLPVVVLDPFLRPLPLINGATANIASADSDQDGVSNFAEWAFRSDRSNAASLPVSPALTFVNAVATTSEIGGAEAEGAHWEYKQAKVTNPDPILEYAIEHSKDMVTWTKITATDLDWKLTETRSTIKVSSRDPKLKGGGFFRSTVKSL